MNVTITITSSLELAAERAGDITHRVYETYFGRCPDSRALMRYIDDMPRGRMLEEVLRLLMADDVHGEREYLRFETKTHVSYGVAPFMYTHLLGAVRDTVREVLGSEWNAQHQAAWDERIATLLDEIGAAAPAA